MKLFVTGGGGFLGLAIVRKLCDQGHKVVSFSRSNYPVLDRLGVTHVQGELSDYSSLKQAMAGCDVVFHIAAKTGVWGRYKDFYRVNVKGTENILQACRESRIRNLIFTSSPSVVYNGNNSEGHNENLPYPKKYDSYYPLTKAIAEKLVMAANDVSLKTVCLRPHLIWGPEDPHFLPRLFKKSKAGKLRVVGRSRNLVDCTYIDNAANAHLQVLAQLLLDPTHVEGKTYFISQDAPVPITDFINQLLATGGMPLVKKYISPRVAGATGWFLEKIYRAFNIAAEPPITLFLAKQLSTSHWYDISAARKDFGYKPEISLEEGMERLRAWVESNPASVLKLSQFDSPIPQ